MKHFSDKLNPVEVLISSQNCRLCSCSNRQSLWTTQSEFTVVLSLKHKRPIFQVQKLCKTFLLIIPRLVINYLGRNFKVFVNKAALKSLEFFQCFDVTGEFKVPVGWEPKSPCSQSIAVLTAGWYKGSGSSWLWRILLPGKRPQPRAVSPIPCSRAGSSSGKRRSPLATCQHPEFPSFPKKQGRRQGHGGSRGGGSRAPQQSLCVLHIHHSTPSPAFPLLHRCSLKSTE